MRRFQRGRRATRRRFAPRKRRGSARRTQRILNSRGGIRL